MEIIDLVQETRDLVSQGKRIMVKLMLNLHAIKEEGSWKNQVATWGRFCEEVLDVKESTASKLATIHTRWISQAKVNPERLLGLDYEKLYLASGLLESESPDSVLNKVNTLSRVDLRAVNRETEPCPHPRKGVFCTSCWENLDETLETNSSPF